MKILIINVVAGYGSTGRIAYDLVEKSISEGNECYLAYGRGDIPEKCKANTVKIGNAFSVYSHLFLTRFFDRQGEGSVLATKKFLKWASEYDPDVLWLHNIHGYYINYELLFDWIKSRPDMKVNWTFHDCWPFTGHCVHFTSINCDAWKEQCENCRLIKNYPTSLFIDNSKKNYKKKKNAFLGVKNMTIYTPSKWLAAQVHMSYLKEYETIVENNKINLEVFTPTLGEFRKDYGIANKKIVLGVAYAWTRSKGYFDFLELASVLDEKYVIVLVGVNDRQKKKLPKNVIGINRTKDARELAVIYSESDVFVNLTYEDTYPTVNLEARACGCKLITYRTGGSTECGDPDYVVEQGDIVSVVKCINEAVDLNE